MSNNLIPIFVTADWHSGHANSLIFDQRPFTDVEHMHRVLINNYNATVPHDGICYFLGDMGKDIHKLLPYLNGTKILIRGNHDKGVNAMCKAGFDAVLFGAVLYIAGERVTLSHCPLKGVWREDLSHIDFSRRGDDVNWHGETRRKHQELTFTDEGQFHLHGHIHSRKGRENKSTKTLGRQYDVGVPANNYYPVSFSTLASWVVLTKREEDKCQKPKK